MKTLSLLLSITVLTAATVSARTWNIDPYGTGNAPTIQAGIDSASVGDTVLVAAGTYTGAGNKNLDFSGTDLVLLSEAGPELTIIDCEGSGRGFYFHSGETAAAVVEGFTITKGYASTTVCAGGHGGGIYCCGSSPTVRSCIFSENAATEEGGGMYCERSHPTVSSSTFSGNTVLYGGGGGMECIESCPNVVNCIFSGNSVYGGGGGMECYGYSRPDVENCTFIGNSSRDGGGMLCFYHSAPTVRSCAFIRNSASERGGGMACSKRSSPRVSSCTFAGNTSGAGYGGAIYLKEAHPIIENTIIAFSPAGKAIWCGPCAGATLTCCDVYGNIGGNWVGPIADQARVNGNLARDPRFCDPDNDDYRLHCDSPCAPGNHPDGCACGLIGALGVERRVPAVVDVDPDVLNLRSRGRWVTCYIELPEGYDPEDIDVSTVTLNETVPAEQHPTEVGDYDGDGIHDRMVKFSRSKVIRVLTLEEKTDLRVSGEVAGQTFEGADTIRVLMPKVTYPNGREVLAVGNECESPPSFALHGCSPNPFTVGTSIRFVVPSSCQVRLAILDVQGRLVRELISEELPARPHTVTWDGTDSSGNKVVPGFYFARLKAGDFIDTARMMLLR